MKENNSFNIIESITNTLNNITLKTDDRGNYTFGFSGDSSTKKNIENSEKKENVSSDSGHNESVKLNLNKIRNSVSEEYNVDIKDDYNDNAKERYIGNQNVSLDSKGVIDSIANELTSVKLQQAIILSEIVGKPRSKTRHRRRF